MNAENGTTELAQAANSSELSQAPGSGDSIGKVEVAKGNVFIVQADGTRVAAKAGQPIFQGDAVETDAEGSIGLVFADNSTFSLAEEGRMVIDEMIYDPSTQEGNSVFNVAQGVFTFVSGQIAKTDVDAMTIKTPLTTIGIRAKAGEEGNANTFTLFADPDGTVGEATVSTEVGTQILSQINQTTIIKSAFLPPSRPVIMPPSVMEKFYAKVAQALPEQPAANDNPEGEFTPEGQTEGPTEGQVEGEGPVEGETQLHGEAPQEGEQQLTDGPAPEGPAPGEGGEPEQAGFAAADEAVSEALAQGASAQEATEIGQQAALDAAVAEARTQGVTDAEVAAATDAFEQAVANGASLEDAFFAAGNAAETAGDAAAVQFDQQQQSQNSGPDINPDGPQPLSGTDGDEPTQLGNDTGGQSGGTRSRTWPMTVSAKAKARRARISTRPPPGFAIIDAVSALWRTKASAISLRASS